MMDTSVEGMEEDPAKQHTIFCWGWAEHGQLGVGGIEDIAVQLPRELTAFQGRGVVDIACGERHSLFALGDGSVWSCGAAEMGQLGHNKGQTRPECVDSLATQVICQVACGNQHSIAVTDTGQVFSWGINTGQLGRGYTDEPFISQPKLVRNLSSFCVVQVTCGHNHTLALTDDCRLFSWGLNEQGQLGLGEFSAKHDTPQEVTSLQGVPLKQIACGASSSFVLTVSGALYGWGENGFGQLGIGDDKNRFFPSLCKSLRHQRVVYVSCGDDHTAVLTQEGGVFTFGAGMFGQLGHNSTQRELLPRKVFELMGSTVTQLVCGRRHTIAYVASNGRIYTFGLGGNGQLGTGSITNRLSPSVVRGPFVPHKGKPPVGLFDSDHMKPYVVHRVFAGGDHCFITVTDPEISVPPRDFRIADPARQIMTLSESKVSALMRVPSEDAPPTETIEEVERLFSSVACLNASFLLSEDEHLGCSSKNAGVDMDAARDCFGRLRVMPNKFLHYWVSGIMEKSLISKLGRSPPDVEALRCYLTLPWCHLFDDPETSDAAICPFGQAMLALQKNPSQIIERWWGKCNSEYFTRLADIYKHTVVHILSMASPKTEPEVRKRQNSLHVCMELLKKLNQVNEENSYVIPYDSFYIHDLRDKVDIRADYVNWIQQSKSKNSLLCFCNYPFVFDAQAKTMLLQTDAMLQMQIAVDEVARRNFSSMFSLIDPVNPCLVLYVTRPNIVQDTIHQLGKQGHHDFKKPMKVVFLGEEAQDAGGVKKVIFLGEDAVDEGGVKKEFFLLLMRELLDPKYGMFEYYEESRLLWFCQQSLEESNMFLLIGVVCGLAIYNGLIVDLPFPLALYKKLLKRKITLDDMKEIQPSVGRSLQSLLDYTQEDLTEVFCLDFEVIRDVYGEKQHIELIPGGANITVTQDNKQKYVDAYLDYFFNSWVSDQFQAFNEGFHRVCGGKVLELFQPKELQAMIVGNENYDWDQLEQNCDYKGDYYRNNQTIILFWEVFREMTLEEKKKFLMFLTGSDRIPIHGMKAIKMIIQPTGASEDFLPVAHTCFNVLDLPRYTSKPKLKEKLLAAIQHTQGFGLV